MARKAPKNKRRPQNRLTRQTGVNLTPVESLLELMEDGNEYQSIVSKVLRPNLVDELVRGIAEVEQVRSRPCLAYVGNVVRVREHCAIDLMDEVPFTEMVSSVPASSREVDVFLATPGGSGQQVARFVNCLRQRFDRVNFLIPSLCMSAGTLFALSGDEIWMTARASLGPIDPQIPTSDGRFVPAQALLLLVDQLQKSGADAMAQNQPVPWTAVRIIDSLDKKELADAITASRYAQQMAAEFLEKYKFKNWTTRKNSGDAVTPEWKTDRANEIASALVSHDRWKSHGHSLSRDVLWQEIRLKINHPEPELERALTRLWALFFWTFDKTPITKVFVSSHYRVVRHSVLQVKPS